MNGAGGISQLIQDDQVQILDFVDEILQDELVRAESAMHTPVSSKTAVQEFIKLLRRLLVRLAEHLCLLPSTMYLNAGSIDAAGPWAVNYGAYGDIFQGTITGKIVALKGLKGMRTNNNNNPNVQRFHREVTILRGLRHDNICVPWGVGSKIPNIPSELCLVLPWYSHGSIDKYMQRTDLSRQGIMNLVCGILEGLSYLHDENVVHGDLHPGNILVDEIGHPHLADFGLANFGDSTYASVAVSARPGASRYMAPEILSPALVGKLFIHHTVESDMYSLGQLFWRLYSGSDPFARETEFQATVAITRGEHPAREESASDIPDEMWKIMEECWSIKPDLRPTANVLRLKMRATAEQSTEAIVGKILGAR
ncbi:hypothetical protein PHLGIDRAFT_478168 [Phlebiopsis gigantea 11061_1 CR5-6]|uniref:Protein kinase domain-containing protein n=1 Tax=Phlebiopsis gigantea (strain 11061_1 CR5-6) TaxID=745531 RepID=A0A0C3S695_PHLG1|nr:hypothetical protein PHLGIDRAFT_478168 [Phlebiopsis gigantea 11061_1 CR5-6]